MQQQIQFSLKISRLPEYIQRFIEINVFDNLNNDPTKALQYLKHSLTIMNELSKAKLNSFKVAQWPLQFLKLPIQDLKIITKALKLVKLVTEYQDLQILLQQAEVVNEMFVQVLQTDSSTVLSNLQNVKLLRNLCSFTFKLLNIVPLDKHNFGLFCNFINYFSQIGFNSQLCVDLNTIYQNVQYNFEDSIVLKAEDILGFGISFIRGLLDNPSIWVSDLLFSDRDPEITGQAEEYLEKQFFTPQTLNHIMRALILNYLKLTNEELDLWKDDSLKFFLHMKYLSNEVKGNLLREKAKNLLAGIQLRFGEQLDLFCQELVQQYKSLAGISNAETFIKKEAMLQVLEIRLNDDTNIDSLLILQIIGEELKTRDNLIMIQQTYTKNIEILNEILELYRFIVEKYASHASQQQHIVQIVQFLKQIWDFFTEKQGQLKQKEDKNQEEEKEEDEINLALQSIKLPIVEQDPMITQGIYDVGLAQVFYSIQTQNAVLGEFTITLLLVLLRRLNNLDIKRDVQEQIKTLKTTILQTYQTQINEILMNIPIQAEYDEEAFKYFILMEEILLSLNSVGQLDPSNPSFQGFLQQFCQRVIGSFIEKVDTFTVIQHVMGTIRLLMLILRNYPQPDLNKSLADFLKNSIQSKFLSNPDQVEAEEKTQWVSVSAGVVSTLILIQDQFNARNVTEFLISNDTFRNLLINQVSTTEETSVILFATYSLNIIPKEFLNQEIYENVLNIYKNHVESEIENQLNYDFRLNRDLMEINDTEEEGMLFEIPDKSLIESDAKEHVLKSLKDRELEVIRAVSNL
ncbi:UNKNOWN [Stylonychia lemnae]|uniref:Uncharacterized protein n=1 Tax=Stylonychia lemnae TaxID=5949 RepID=A0A078A1B5_STYLE|nr:UNKNOWN [Stylonychia lemnae]|eukprot:CDW75637.1 UNKNOWN [Stylonychia lemnae]